MANQSFAPNHDIQMLLMPAARGTTTTSYVQPFANGGGANRVAFLLVIGTISSGTVDFKLVEALTSGGGSAQDISGKAITQLGTSTDEVVVSIELEPGDLDNADGYTYVAATTTVSTGTPIWSVLMIKYDLRNSVSTFHSTYSQQV